MLGPAGFGLSFAMAGMIGGAVGGAITGGLEGGWKGALIGAGIGGALGGLGGWGFGIAQAHQMAGQFTIAMLAAGAGVAAATNSWDSFAGGLIGGFTGYKLGSGLTNQQVAPALAKAKASAAPNNNSQNALSVDKKPTVKDSLTNNKRVRINMEKAWQESFSSDRQTVQEQAAWVRQPQEGQIAVDRWPAGDSGSITIPPKPSDAIASFHTHPYAPNETFVHMPSRADVSTTITYGVPDYIVDKEGIMRVDPETGAWEDVFTRSR